MTVTEAALLTGFVTTLLVGAALVLQEVKYKLDTKAHAERFYRASQRKVRWIARGIRTSDECFGRIGRGPILLHGRLHPPLSQTLFPA